MTVYFRHLDLQVKFLSVNFSNASGMTGQWLSKAMPQQANYNKHRKKNAMTAPFRRQIFNLHVMDV